MKLPSAVIVGPHTYKVQKVARLKQLGLCNYDSGRLSLKSGMEHSKEQEVLLHEVLHACGYPALCGKDEEFVDGVAPQLLQVLQQNPRLVEYLTK